VRLTATTVECYFKGKRVAAHVRSNQRGRHTTLAEHMPEAHRKHLQWTPGRLLNWAHSIGAGVRDVVKWQLDNRPHPEQGYRACLGLLRLAKHYGNERLEAACRRALAIGAPTRKRISLHPRGQARSAPRAVRRLDGRCQRFTNPGPARQPARRRLLPFHCNRRRL
jgi:transposase